jgi:excisionase family DNA binding protein
VSSSVSIFPQSSSTCLLHTGSASVPGAVAQNLQKTVGGNVEEQGPRKRAAAGTTVQKKRGCVEKKGSAEEYGRYREEENMEQDDFDKELLTVREVARRLRVDETTVRRWVKSGALLAVVLPHRGPRQTYRIKKETLQQILDGETGVSLIPAAQLI